MILSPRACAIPAAGLVLAFTAWVALAPPQAVAAGAVVSVAVPDSGRLAELREAIAAAPVFRVVADSGRERVTEPMLDSSGVRSASWEPVASRRAALFGTGATAPVAARPPIPWSRISALETGRPKTLQGAVGGTVIGLEAARSAYAAPRAPRRGAKLAAGLGAALAWDLADLPRHGARLPEPIGGFTAGAAFAAGAMNAVRGDGSESAIDVLIGRWNTIYPPYALAHGCEVPNDH